MSKFVYVCYEANHGELIWECGEVNNMKVVSSVEKAVEYVENRIKLGQEDGFVIDEEGDVTDLKKYIRNGSFELVMFLMRQENWSESFSIMVNRKEIE